MIANADEVVDCIADKIREILRTKEYGTFGITITMQGVPLTSFGSGFSGFRYRSIAYGNGYARPYNP